MVRRHTGDTVTAASGTISQAGRAAGLLEKLLAVIRPEFRREVLVFDPRDPVFGGPPCAVPECGGRPGAGRCAGATATAG